MLFEERLEAAERRRIDGNELFKAGSTTEALGKYAMALSYMDQDFMFQLQGPHEDKANAVRLPILLNMAACHLQLSDYKGAIEASSQACSTATVDWQGSCGCCRILFFFFGLLSTRA